MTAFRVCQDASFSFWGHLRALRWGIVCHSIRVLRHVRKAIWSSLKLNLSNHANDHVKVSIRSMIHNMRSRYSVEIAPTVLPKSLVKRKHPSCSISFQTAGHLAKQWRCKALFKTGDICLQFNYVSKALWCPLLASKCCATIRAHLLAASLNQATFDHARLGPEAPVKWSEIFVKTRRTCTSPWLAFGRKLARILESSPVLSASRSSSSGSPSPPQKHAQSTQSTSTPWTHSDTTFWYFSDTVAGATSQHDTITRMEKTLSPWEWSLMTTSLIHGKLHGPDHATGYCEDFHKQLRFQCLHPFGLGLASVTWGLTKHLHTDFKECNENAFTMKARNSANGLEVS